MYGGNPHSDVWCSNCRPLALTLAIDGAIRRLLSIFVEWVGFLIRDLGVFIERVRFLTLSLGVVKRLRDFIEWVCGLVERMRGFIERMYFVPVRLGVGGFGKQRGRWTPSSESKRDLRKFLASLYHPPLGGVDVV